MSVFLEWEEPKEFALKKHKEKLSSSSKFIWGEVLVGLFFGSFFMLIWYLGTITNQNDGNNSPPSFWVAFSMAVGLALFFPIGIHLVNTKGPPSKIRVKITNKGIRMLGSGRDRTVCFADIANFCVAKEPIGESFVNILEFKDFDGRTATVGISSQISTETLNSLLSERTNEIRTRIKNAQMNQRKSWGHFVGSILLAVGLLALSFSILFFSGLRHNQNDSFDIMKNQLNKVKSQFDSADSNSLQNEAFGKVATRAYYAYYKVVDIKMSQLPILIGTIGAVLLLIGLNLILWAKSRYYFKRMRKLEIICSEITASQSKAK